MIREKQRNSEKSKIKIIQLIIIITNLSFICIYIIYSYTNTSKFGKYKLNHCSLPF